MCPPGPRSMDARRCWHGGAQFLTLSSVCPAGLHFPLSKFRRPLPRTLCDRQERPRTTLPFSFPPRGPSRVPPFIRILGGSPGISYVLPTVIFAKNCRRITEMMKATQEKIKVRGWIVNPTGSKSFTSVRGPAVGFLFITFIV